MISEQLYRRKREEKYKFEQRLIVALEERATRRNKNWFSFNQNLHHLIQSTIVNLLMCEE